MEAGSRREREGHREVTFLDPAPTSGVRRTCDLPRSATLDATGLSVVVRIEEDSAQGGARLRAQIDDIVSHHVVTYPEARMSVGAIGGNGA